MSECERATENLLIGDPRCAAEGKDPAVAGAKQKECFEEREGHDYWTLRGNEETSNLLAVRSAVADGMELLMWERRYEGKYKGKGRRQKQMKAYTRTLMGKIMLKQKVGFMGKELRVAVVHLHFLVANKTRASADTTTTFGHGL